MPSLWPDGTFHVDYDCMDVSDDIVPMLTAYQIEWNKMHTLIGLQAGLGERLTAAAEAGSWEPELQAETQRILQLSEDDWPNNYPGRIN